MKPNAGHIALARLEAEATKRGATFHLVTQNVDNLHEAAGSKNLIHMHGELMKAWCTNCDHAHGLGGRSREGSQVSALQGARRHAARRRVVRRDAVSHGPPVRSRAPRATCSCPSAPAATSIRRRASSAARGQAGAHTVELNLEPSEGVTRFAEAIHGRGTEIVPAYVEKLLAAL